MSNLTLPAPLWRRLISAVYDGLLLLGLWMAAALIELIIRGQLLGLPPSTSWMQAFFFGVGLVFFGRSWTCGGQTLGMRAWHLQVRRLDGMPLRWPIAAVRYAVMLTTWMMSLMPLLLTVPRLADDTGVQAGALACALLALVLVLLMRLDGRRRAPCDWVTGTEVVRLAAGATSPR